MSLFNLHPVFQSMPTCYYRAPGAKTQIPKANGGAGDAPVTQSTDETPAKKRTAPASSSDSSAEEEPTPPPVKTKKGKKAKKEKKVCVGDFLM